MDEKPTPLICILGATAAGKTRLAVRIAANGGGEVISADSRQVYRHMDIGTGKDKEDYNLNGTTIPAHLIDIVEPGYEYNLYEFKRDCVQVIRDVSRRGRLPVLCGGTGMYLSAILEDYQLVSAPPDPKRRARLQKMPDHDLQTMLRSHGPLHNTSDLLDRRRLIRAIEVAEADPASRAPSIRLDARIFGLRWERTVLRHRITRRLRERLDNGLIEEVQSLLAMGLSHDQLIFYGLEYREISRYLRHELTWDEMFACLNAAIHQFAKRQETWFRRMERKGLRIEWLDGQNPPQVNAQLAGFC